MKKTSIWLLGAIAGGAASAATLDTGIEGLQATWVSNLTTGVGIRTKAPSCALTGSAAPPQAPVAEQAPTQQTAAVKPAALTEPAPQPVRGVPLVVDSGTLMLRGATVHLNGIEGEAGEAAQDLTRYIAGASYQINPQLRTLLDWDYLSYRTPLLLADPTRSQLLFQTQFVF